MPFRPSVTVARLDRLLYPAYRDRWDEDLFRSVIKPYLTPDSHVLDLGAGAGIVPQTNFHDDAARVVGVDLDPRVLENPHLHEAHIAPGEHLPCADEAFDFAFSDNVLEHLADPLSVFREVQRVLKPGARFVVKTPNRRHYVAQSARLTPLSFHRFINRRRGRDGADTFPTLYRANTPEKLRELCAAAGLVAERIDLVDGRPEYLRLTAPTYLVGWMIERATNGIPALERFRAGIIAVLRKP